MVGQQNYHLKRLLTVGNQEGGDFPKSQSESGMEVVVTIPCRRVSRVTTQLRRESFSCIENPPRLILSNRANQRPVLSFAP